MQQTTTVPSRANSAIVPANSISAFEVIPSGAALGAEIRGADFSLPVGEDVKNVDHLVLLPLGV